MWDELPPGEEKRRRDFRRWGRFITEATAATGTLLLSATVFGTAAFFALRGSRIVVLPIEEVLLYRDGTSASAVLSVAIPARIMNLASLDHGDVVRQVILEVNPKRGRPRAAFDYLNSVTEQTAASVAQAEQQARECRLGTRCLAIEELLILEEPAKLLSFPGGVGRAEKLGFTFFPIYCRGEGCARFGVYDKAAGFLRSQSNLEFVLTLEFHGEGRIRAACSLTDLGPKGRRAALDYLEEHGWAELKCDRGD